MTRQESIKNLMQIPGVGKSIANDLYLIKIRKVDDLKGKNPEELFRLSNAVGALRRTDACFMFFGVPFIMLKLVKKNGKKRN